jgi:hypothetical protein
VGSAIGVTDPAFENFGFRHVIGIGSNAENKQGQEQSHNQSLHNLLHLLINRLEIHF